MTSRTEVAWIAVVAAVVVTGLTACASEPSGIAGTSSPSVISETPTPTPTCAVPEQPGVEPPEGCIVYDGEANMAINELYRERMEMTDAARSAAAEHLGSLTSALNALRDTGAPLTEDAVREVFDDAGLVSESVQTRDDHGDILFGVGVDGGCVFGAVDAEAVTVDVGGYIMDGGCLAAVGH